MQVRRSRRFVGASDGRAPRMGPMTAIIYFGEMLVASLLAIVLLAISRLPLSSDAVLFGGGVVALTLAEYLVHRFVLHRFAPTEHRQHHANPNGANLGTKIPQNGSDPMRHRAPAYSS